MPIKAIIFDLDNTLIDFRKMKKLSCEAAFEAMIKNGLKISKKKAMKVMFELYNKHGWEYQKIFQLFLKEVHKKLDYRIMASGIVAYRKVKEGLLYSYPGVPSVLDKLKKRYKLIILSDAPKVQAWIRLCAMGIQDKFDHVITYDDTRRKKPDKKPFLLALKKLKLKPEDCVMVGDSIKRDLNPAKDLGMKTVFATYGEIEKEKGKVDYKIKDIKELSDIVDNL